jgi:hypothetical protein
VAGIIGVIAKQKTESHHEFSPARGMKESRRTGKKVFLFFE